MGWQSRLRAQRKTQRQLSALGHILQSQHGSVSGQFVGQKLVKTTREAIEAAFQKKKPEAGDAAADD